MEMLIMQFKWHLVVIHDVITFLQNANGLFGVTLPDTYYAPLHVDVHQPPTGDHVFHSLQVLDFIARNARASHHDVVLALVEVSDAPNHISLLHLRDAILQRVARAHRIHTGIHQAVNGKAQALATALPIPLSIFRRVRRIVSNLTAHILTQIRKRVGARSNPDYVVSRHRQLLLCVDDSVVSRLSRAHDYILVENNFVTTTNTRCSRRLHNFREVIQRFQSRLNR